MPTLWGAGDLIRIFDEARTTVADVNVDVDVDAVIAGLRADAAAPGADVFKISQALAQLSSQLSNSGRPDDGVKAQRAAVEVLAAAPSPAGGELDFRIVLAEARHNLIARLIDAHHLTEAATTTPAALAAYRDYVALPGADILRVSRDLNQLSSQLVNNGLPNPAVTTQQTLVEVLRSFGMVGETPSPVGDALVVLMVRLLTAERVAEAAVSADDATAAYAVAIQGVTGDLGAIANDLSEQSRRMWSSGLIGEAIVVHRAATAALTGEDLPTPLPTTPLLPASVQKIVQVRARRDLITASLDSLAGIARGASLTAQADNTIAVKTLALTVPRCGTDDAPGQNGGIGPLAFGPPMGRRWTRGSLTVSINLAGCNFPGAAPFIISAFQAWQAASGAVAGGFFQFTFIPPGSGEDIRVTFVGSAVNPRFGTPGGVLARGGYPGTADQGNLQFDMTENWSNTAQLFNTALHEIGHLLGLSHSNSTASLMYPISFLTQVIDPETTQALGALYGWTAPRQLSDRATASRPCLGVVSQSSFTTSVQIPQMVWRGTGDDHSIYHSELRAGGWSPQQPIADIGSSLGPSLAQIDAPSTGGGALSTGLLMAWRGIEDKGIFWTRNIGSGWEPQRNIPGVGSSHAPAVATAAGTTYMAWKGIHGDNGIYWSTYDPVNQRWSAQNQIAGRGTSDSPALVAYNNVLYMFWKGVEDDHTAYWAFYDPAIEQIWRPQRQIEYFTYTTAGGVPHAIGTSGPLIATRRGDSILIAWKGALDDSTIWFSLFRDGEFSGQVNRTETGTQTGPAVVQTISRGPTAGQITETTFMAWKGVEGDNTIWWSRL